MERTSTSLDFVRAMVADDMRTGKYDGRVITRFPPEPNGYLHIGHAKSIVLNFGLAAEYGGRCHLRFDDTNPETEDIRYVESIQQDVRWLGYDWGEHLYFASDYFEHMYAFGEHLIRTGHAYVDSSSDEEIRDARGTVTQPGRPTAYRERSADESLDLFRRMRAGEFADGAHVLRAKIDLASTNMLMRDPILFRIRHAHHYRRGDDWCIYPLYDYAHPIEDALENITHSLCTLEFDNNREVYDWVVAHVPRGSGELEVPPDSHPEQTEFARLALDYTVMSKRKLLQLVNGGHVSGWDDPRMPTIAGLRRRGVTPESIRAFCESIGVAKSNSRVDLAKFEHVIRDDLNQRAPRVMGVLRPLKVTLTNWPAGKVEMLDAPYWPHDVPREGSRPVPFSGELLVDRDDFSEDPPKGFFRLRPGGEVRLRYGYIIRCDDVVKNDAGEIVELRCSYDPQTRGGDAGDRRVKGTIHWVSAAHALPCEVRLYDRLFTAADPEVDDDVPFTTHLNPDSLVVVSDARVEPSLAGAAAGDRFQFERLGYFMADLTDSRTDALVFNRIVTLRDTWARQAAEAQRPPDRDAPGVRDTARPTRTAGRSPVTSAAAARATVDTATEAAVLTGDATELSGAQRQAARMARPRRDSGLDARRERYEREHEITSEQADVLTRDAAIADFYEAAVRTAVAAPATVASYIVNEMPRDARESVASLPIGGAAIGELVDFIERGDISSSAAREVLAELIANGGSAAAIIDGRRLRQVSDEAALAAAVDEVIAANDGKVNEYRSGKSGLLGFFIGQVMARTGGRANPAMVRELVLRRLHGR
jgi:glutaminyl-tRNA synthetase